MLKTIISICFLLFLFTKANGQLVENVTLHNNINFEISVERPLYYKEEPLNLIFSIKNEGTEPVIGLFSIYSLSPNIEIYVQKPNTDFSKYNFTATHGRAVPSKIVPGDAFTNKVMMLFDTKNKKFLFSEPGEYRLKALYHEAESTRLLESNVIIVQVVDNEDEKQALLAYSDEFVAKLIQGDSFIDVRAEDYQRALDKAIFLAQQYPQSLYTKILVNTKLEELHRKVVSSSLKGSEKVLYEILKERDYEGLLQEKKNNSGLNLDQKTLDYLLKKSIKAPITEEDNPNKQK